MNPITYAKGLMDELDGAVRTGAKDVEQSIRTELAAIADDVRQAVQEYRGVVEPQYLKTEDDRQVENNLHRDIRAVGERLDEVLGGSKRTTKAAAAPEKAVPPPAK